MVHTILNVKFPSSNYHNALKNKYAIAINLTKDGANNYKGFDTIHEITDLLDNVKNSSIKRKCLFEVIKTRKAVKPYFDIDKSNLTKAQFDEFIETFIANFNRFFDVSISLNDILIYARDEKTGGIIGSSHIIVYKHKILFKKIQDFTNYFNIITDNKYKNANDNFLIDDAVYGGNNKNGGHNRLFNLPYNTKVKYVEADIDNPKYFIPYKRQADDVKDYFISYTDEISNPELTGNRAFTVFKTVSKFANQLKLSHLRNAFNKLKQTPEAASEIRANINPKSIDNIKSSVEYLILNLPKRFFTDENKTNEWAIITLIFQKYELDQENVKKWLEYSSIQSNGKWTTRNNQDYYNSNTTKERVSKLKNGIPSFLKIVNQYLYPPINFNNDIPLIDYIFDKINKEIKKSEIDDILEKNKYMSEHKINKHTFALTETHSYNYKTGFLYKHEIIIGNYFYDVCLIAEFKDSKLNNTIELQDINEMTQKSIDFINNDESILSCKAKWGSGKTYIIVKNIFNEAQKNGMRVIFITENNALNAKYSSEFNIQSHINNKNLNQNHCIVCSSESIHKVSFKDTDILILDEYETILSHYESDTFKNGAYQKFSILSNALKTVKKIVILDADLSRERIELLSKIRNTVITTYDVKTNNFSDYSFNIFVGKSSFDDAIITECIKPNNKIIIPSSSKNYNRKMMDIIMKIDKTKTILLIDSDAKNGNVNCKINDGENVALFFKNGIISYPKYDNLEQFIIKEDVDIFFYSPSIKTGISINSQYFNKCFGYACSLSCNAREFIQMLFRARNLKDKEINIFASGSFCRIKQFITNAQIKKHVLNPIEAFYTGGIFNGNFDVENYTQEIQNSFKSAFLCDTTYMECKFINEKEIYNSKTRFNQDFIMRLKYNHNIPIKFINPSFDLEKMENTETEIPNETLRAFVECPLVNCEEYSDLTEDEWLKKQKHMFFYQTYFIRGISDKNIIDKSVYDRINNEGFYNLYLNRTIRANYKLLKYLSNSNPDKESLNKTATDIKNKLDAENLTQYENAFDKRETYAGRDVILINLLEYLKIDLLKINAKFKPSYTITRKEMLIIFNTIKTSGFLKTIENYYKNYEIENPFNFDRDSKTFYTNLYDIVKALLAYLNIDFKYVDFRNTTRPSDKLIFSYCNFKSNNIKYNGRLTADHFKINAESAHKLRNGYIYKRENGAILKCVKCENPKFYNTYETIINSRIKKMKEYVLPEGDQINHQFFQNGNIVFEFVADDKVKKIYDKTVMLDLKKYLSEIIQPEVISSFDYKKAQNELFYEFATQNKINENGGVCYVVSPAEFEEYDE